VVPISQAARAAIEGTAILVTGAGGSLGSAVTKQLLSLSPRRLILLELSEHELHRLDLELDLRDRNGIIVPVLGDIRDELLMNDVFSQHRPEIVFHTAACKHVALLERQIYAALSVNLLGTYLVARMASKYEVRKFISLSTDKAVNPVSAMGVSKRLAELALMQMPSGKTAFVSVRFGNVVGSRGSVVPIFQRQIRRREPVTITDPQASRYFISIEKAVRTIIEIAGLDAGADIYTPVLEKPIKITELARDLISAAGLNPDSDILIVFTGLRAGEKISEDLKFQRETLTSTICPGIFQVIAPPTLAPPPKQWVPRIEEMLRRREYSDMIEMICELVSEYRPSAELLDHLGIGPPHRE
jgi:FlaA1/EpsC-like NDP-sugar epimerase